MLMKPFKKKHNQSIIHSCSLTTQRNNTGGFFQCWRNMLLKYSWCLFVDSGGFRGCFRRCRHNQRERALMPYIEVPVGRVENLWFSLNRHFVMFYIIQLIKHKSLTKDLDSPWTSALHRQQLFALNALLSPNRQLLNAQLPEHLHLPFFRNTWYLCERWF